MVSPPCGVFVQVQGRPITSGVSLFVGSQNRVILCTNRHTDEEVPERKCDSAARPGPEEEPCNTHACPPL